MDLSPKDYYRGAQRFAERALKSAGKLIWVPLKQHRELAVRILKGQGVDVREVAEFIIVPVSSLNG